MDVLVRITILALFGSFLVFANIWFFTAVARGFHGGDLVVAPIRVSGDAASTAPLQDALASMLVVRLKAITNAFAESQASLDSNKPDLTNPSPMMFGSPRTVSLRTKLLEPTKIELRAAGLDVGGLLPQAERWLIKDRTLSFSVSIHNGKTVISGDVEALGLRNAPPIWLQISESSPTAIVDALAYAIVQRAWANDESEIADLTHDEFVSIIQAVEDVSRINRRVRQYGVPEVQEFAKVSEITGPIAERIRNWDEFSLFAAMVAERSGQSARAMGLFSRLKGKTHLIDDASLEQHIVSNGGLEAELRPYQSVLDEAYRELSAVFVGDDVPKPKVKLLEYSVKNAFWDGEALMMPPGIADIPDILSHELAHVFVRARWKGAYRGEAGAIEESYCDVLSAYVVQRSRGESAAHADWNVAPGAVAWVLDGQRNGRRDQLAIRSIRAPGSAYRDHPVLGTDAQVSNYQQYIRSGDGGEPFINSGIGSRAFYEVAIKIGTPKAVKIWVDALSRFEVEATYPFAAAAIRDAARALYGDKSNEAKAVDDAWRSVGLP